MDRVQENLLARAERSILTSLCRRLPGWVTPDGLTALGFAGALLVLAGYALSRVRPGWLWLAAAGYLLHWFGDSLDGSLARFRAIERPRYGHFLDHSVDALANTLGMVGLGLTSFVDMRIALFTLIGYLLLTLHVMLRVRATGAMQLSFVGGGPTELRLGLIVLTLAMWWFGPRPLATFGWSLYDVAVGGMGVILVVLFVLHTAVVATALRREGEPR